MLPSQGYFFIWFTDGFGCLSLLINNIARKVIVDDLQFQLKSALGYGDVIETSYVHIHHTCEVVGFTSELIGNHIY